MNQVTKNGEVLFQGDSPACYKFILDQQIGSIFEAVTKHGYRVEDVPKNLKHVPDSEKSIDYEKMVLELNELKDTWHRHPDNHRQLDAVWVCVKALPKYTDTNLIRLVTGVKFDEYWGWIVWSGSTQDNGCNFTVAVAKIAWKYRGLVVKERQL